MRRNRKFSVRVGYCACNKGFHRDCNFIGGTVFGRTFEIGICRDCDSPLKADFTLRRKFLGRQTR